MIGSVQRVTLFTLCIASTACIPNTATPEGPRVGERVGVTAYAGTRVPFRDPAHKETLADDGYEVTSMPGATTVASISVRTQLNPDGYGELLLTRDLQRSRQHYSRTEGSQEQTLDVDELETSAFLVLTSKLGPLKMGVGGGLQAVSTQAYGLYQELNTSPVCQYAPCSPYVWRHGRMLRTTLLSLGGLASVNVPLPETRRFFGDVRVQGRWFAQRGSEVFGYGEFNNRAGPSVVLEVGGGWRTNW